MSSDLWVPEWTMESCGEAIEFARPEFSRLISPRPVIKSNALFVDGHLLDEIDEIFTIREDNVLDIVIRLEEWLEKHSKSMFSAYHGDFQRLMSDGSLICCIRYDQLHHDTLTSSEFVSRVKVLYIIYQLLSTRVLDYYTYSYVPSILPTMRACRFAL